MDGWTDPKGCARLAAISNEALGMLNSFEDAVPQLLPACPVAAKVYKKRKGTHISGIGGGLKGGTGPKTGVELCYYKPTEYKTLSTKEKDEPRELRPESKASKGENKNKIGKSDGKNRGKCQRDKKPWKKNFKGKVAALKKQHKKDMEEMTELATLISGTKKALPQSLSMQQHILWYASTRYSKSTGNPNYWRMKNSNSLRHGRLGSCEWNLMST